MEHFHAATTTVVESHSHASMRWSAIIGGWLVATAIASLMYVAGLAIGFTAFDPYNAAATAKGIGTGTAIWMVLTTSNYHSSFVTGVTQSRNHEMILLCALPTSMSFIGRAGQNVSRVENQSCFEVL